MTQTYKAGQIVRTRKGGIVELFVNKDYGSSHPLIYYIDDSSFTVDDRGRYHEVVRCLFDIVELIKDVGEDMYKTFTKDMLKDGMKVVVKNRNTYFYDSVKNRGIDLHGWLNMDSYNEFLNCSINEAFDIMEVYSLGTLIWKREEKTEQEKKIEELEASAKLIQEQIKQLKEMK